MLDGVEPAALPAGEFRRLARVVPQEAHLFTGDVASNIAYGRPDAAPAEIEAAARAVGALDMVASLPGGFHQPSVSAARPVRGPAPTGRAGEA